MILLILFNAVQYVLVWTRTAVHHLNMNALLDRDLDTVKSFEDSELIVMFNKTV